MAGTKVESRQVGRSVVRDAGRERHVRAIAVWYRVGALLGVVGIGGTLALGSANGADPGALVVGLLPTLVAVVVTGLLAAGLWSYHPAARWATVALQGVAALAGLSSLSLLALPSSARGVGANAVMAASLLQLAWAVAVGACLLAPRTAPLFEARYREHVVRTPGVQVAWWTSSFFAIPAAVLGVVLVAAVALVGGAARLL